MVVSENDTELTSNAMLKWQENRQVEWHYIASGKPMQNSFNRDMNFNCQWNTTSSQFEINNTMHTYCMYAFVFLVSYLAIYLYLYLLHAHVTNLFISN